MFYEPGKTPHNLPRDPFKVQYKYHITHPPPFPSLHCTPFVASAPHTRSPIFHNPTALASRAALHSLRTHSPVSSPGPSAGSAPSPLMAPPTSRRIRNSRISPSRHPTSCSAPTRPRTTPGKIPSAMPRRPAFSAGRWLRIPYGTPSILPRSRCPTASTNLRVRRSNPRRACACGRQVRETAAGAVGPCLWFRRVP